jgi:hypothetical protein
VRNHEKKISGIVTTSDLSVQLRQLAEPFLLVGEIENHIRRIIDGKFTQKELGNACDPSDTQRKIGNVADLAFGEYVRLFENPEHWNKLNIPLDRKEIVKRLERVRMLRNDIMHFDPDGLPPEDLEYLRDVARLLQKLRSLGIT